LNQSAAPATSAAALSVPQQTRFNQETVEFAGVYNLAHEFHTDASVRNKSFPEDSQPPLNPAERAFVTKSSGILQSI
jgi:hypothetical protein